MLTNHQLRDLTRGLRQSEPSKSLPNVILSAEIHALICGYFAQYDKPSQRQRHAKPPPLRRGLGVGCQRQRHAESLSLFIKRKGTRQRRGFVILSAEIHALICGYFASLSMTKADGKPPFKKKAKPKNRLLVLDCHAVF